MADKLQGTLSTNYDHHDKFLLLRGRRLYTAQAYSECSEAKDIWGGP